MAAVDGVPIPPERIRLEGSAIKIYDENEDVLRVIAAGRPSPPEGRDPAAVLAVDGRFGTLLAALEAAGLLDSLRRGDPLTVLAPTDEAFTRLPEGRLGELLKPGGREAFRELLLRHVVPGRVTSRDPAGGDVIRTLAGGGFRSGVEGGRLTVANSRVVANDLPAGNGLVHAIDAVLSAE